MSLFDFDGSGGWTGAAAPSADPWNTTTEVDPNRSFLEKLKFGATGNINGLSPETQKAGAGILQGLQKSGLFGGGQQGAGKASAPAAPSPPAGGGLAQTGQAVDRIMAPFSKGSPGVLGQGSGGAVMPSPQGKKEAALMPGSPHKRPLYPSPFSA